jgi:hypothetical protein
MSTVIVRPLNAPPHATPARTALFLGCGVVLLLVMFLIAKSNPGHQAAVPASFLPYVATDKSFVCDAPAGWTMDEAGVESSESAHVLFQQDVAKVEIVTDQGAGAMADIIAQNGQTGVQTLPGGLQMAPTSAPSRRWNRCIGWTCHSMNSSTGTTPNCRSTPSRVSSAVPVCPNGPGAA